VGVNEEDEDDWEVNESNKEECEVNGVFIGH